MTTPKPVKAWAVVSPRGVMACFAVRTRRIAMNERMDEDETVIRVIITPIPPKRKAKGKRK